MTVKRMKEDVSVLFVWRPLNFLVKGEMENCGDLSWDTFWISLRTCLIVSLRLGWMPVVPDVTVVLAFFCGY